MEQIDILLQYSTLSHGSEGDSVHFPYSFHGSEG